MMMPRNLIIVIKAVAVALWFQGLGRVFDLVMPNKDWITAGVMLFVATLLLLMDDGDLSELYKMDPPVAAIMAHQSQAQTIEERRRMR